jgi:RNA polymerase sigma factor (sigma-70 family)
MPLHEDRALLDGYRRGDARAFDAIVAEYEPMVVMELQHGFPLRSGGRFFGFKQAFELEDAIQGVWLTVFSESARRHYDGIRPFRPYLRRIVRNHVHAIHARKRRSLARMEGVRDQPASAEPRPVDDTEWQACQRQAHRIVEDVLGRCSDRERAVHDALFVRGLSERKAGALLSLRRADVQKAKASIFKRMLREFKARGIQSVDAVLVLAGVLCLVGWALT